MARSFLFLLVSAAGYASGCNHASAPDAIADRFVDAYYVEYDFPKALTMAEGAAASRLVREQRLAEEARGKVALSPSRTGVYYGRPERHQVGAELVHYTFHLEIRQGLSDLRRSAVVMLGLRSGAWKVIGFREASELSEGASDGAIRESAARTSTGAPAP